jgi:hypothetical protein
MDSLGMAPAAPMARDTAGTRETSSINASTQGVQARLKAGQLRRLMGRNFWLDAF